MKSYFKFVAHFDKYFFKNIELVFNFEMFLVPGWHLDSTDPNSVRLITVLLWTCADRNAELNTKWYPTPRLQLQEG